MGKNIYAGKNSIVKINVSGKVNTFKEIMLITYALSYDLKDLRFIERNGRETPATIDKINGRFSVLYALANKYSKKAINEIKKFHNLAIQRYHGMTESFYVISIRNIAKKYLDEHEINEIELLVERVNAYTQTNSIINKAKIEKLFGWW